MKAKQLNLFGLFILIDFLSFQHREFLQFEEFVYITLIYIFFQVSPLIYSLDIQIMIHYLRLYENQSEWYKITIIWWIFFYSPYPSGFCLRAQIKSERHYYCCTYLGISEALKEIFGSGKTS